MSANELNKFDERADRAEKEIKNLTRKMCKILV